MTRSCDECTACCTVMGVEELKKPNYVACSFIKDGGGCKIYGQHPPTCKAWSCAWVHPISDWLLPEDWMRPDRLGVVFTLNEGVGHDGLPSIYLIGKQDEARGRMVWQENDVLMRFLRKLSMTMTIMMGTRKTDAVIQNGEVLYIDVEQRKELDAGRAVTLSNGTQVVDEKQPGWLVTV